MASPVVAGTKVDKDVGRQTTHTITFPLTLSVNDLLLGIATFSYGTVTEIIKTDNLSAVGWSTSSSHRVVAIAFWGLSLGGANDSFVFKTVPVIDSGCVANWIVYRITGHGYDLENPLSLSETHAITGTNFPVLACPLLLPAVTEDGLWLDFAMYSEANSITERSGFGTKLESLKASSTEASIASARQAVLAEDQIVAGNWSTGAMATTAYITVVFKVSPGSYPGGSPPADPGTGFGIYVAKDRIGIP